MNIPDYVQDQLKDSNSDWSTDWKTPEGDKIYCPKCGCSAVSPVPVDEAFNYINEDSDGDEDLRKHMLTNDLGFDAKDLDVNEIENLHRKHGIFVCGNANCMEDSSPFFSIFALKKNNYPSIKTWGENEKTKFGYNNPWSIDIEKLQFPKTKKW